MTAPTNGGGAVLRRFPLLPARVSVRRAMSARRIGVATLALLAILPAAFVLVYTAEARRDVVYWDEFDTALALVLQLEDGTTPGEFARRMFAVNNEHRMLTSRTIFALSHWLTGTVNFSFVSLVGIAWIVGLSGLLLAHVRGGPRRLLLAGLLAAFVYQLQHYENFLWSGASIDHFQVVLLAGAALLMLGRARRAAEAGRPATGAFAGATLLAFLATFTLAHGLLVWAAGAAMWATGKPAPRRWLVGWCAVGAAVTAAYFVGFEVNSSQRFASASAAGVWQVVVYWLALLGAVPALGFETAGPWLGVAALAALGLQAKRGAAEREPVLFWFALFAVAALGLIAAGRAAESGGVVLSRYHILGAVVWAVVLFLGLERHVSGWRIRHASAAVLLLAGFNVAANARSLAHAESWLECRNRAVLAYQRHGEDGHGPFTLHPQPAHATALLREAERRGVYRLGSLCQPRRFPEAIETGNLHYFIDELTVNSSVLYVDGWAALPGAVSRRGQMHLVLRSADARHVYTTAAITRPDVAEVTQERGWVRSGFRFALPRDRLPSGEFQVGLLLRRGGRAEYTMTAHRVQLTGEGKALLANQE